jgi:hypothetical protein
MLVVDLRCAHDHGFEGWFGSADALADQQARGLLTCPVCGTNDVSRRPSATRLNVSGARSPVSESGEKAGHGTESSQSQPAAAPAPLVDQAPVPAPGDLSADVRQALHAVYVQALRHIVANTEDVGRDFAQEVRRMHRGDEPERPIRGAATSAERAELAEEGIKVMSLPVPEGFDGPLQ